MKTNFESGVLYHGDCLEVMQDRLDAESVDLCVTSPPYNAEKDYEEGEFTPESYFEFTRQWIEHTYRVIKPGGKLFINIGFWSGSRKKRILLPTRVIEIAEAAGFKFTSWITWVKGSLKAPQQNGSGWGDIYGVSPFFINGEEPVLYFTKGSRKRVENQHPDWVKFVRSPWVFPTSKEREHSAPFPIELPHRAIMTTTVPGWTVLDPFGGSGTTGVAAMRNDRKFILIERDDRYRDLCEKRLHEEEQKIVAMQLFQGV